MWAFDIRSGARTVIVPSGWMISETVFRLEWIIWSMRIGMESSIPKGITE